MNKLILSLFSACLLLFSFQAASDDKKPTLIVQLQSRDKVVELYVLDTETRRYTVKDKKGRVLATLLSNKELKKQFPNVYAMVEGNDKFVRLDAGL